MQINLNKIDLIYLTVILLSAYFLLTLLPNKTISGYERLAALKSDIDVSTIGILSVGLGILFIFLLYLISRIFFKQSQFPVLVGSLILISSPAFITNFMQGGVSDLIYSLLSSPIIPQFEIEKVWEVLPLLPLSLISMYMLFSNKKNSYVFTGIAAIIAAFFVPLLALPFLFILTIDGISKINNIKDHTMKSTFAGGIIAATIALIIIKPSFATLALSLLIGIVIAIVMLSFENKRTMLYLLIITLIMFSIENGMSYVFGAERVDSGTIDMLNKLKEIDGRIAIASYYSENITNIAYVETDKAVVSTDAFLFLFTNRTPNFDYLLLDTLVLDNPKEYARIAGTVSTFETFTYIGIQKQGNIYYQLFYDIKGQSLVIPVDSNGNIIGNNVILNGVEESIFRLLYLNATNSAYERYIHPRSDSGKNLFKVLYPDQFGTLAGITIKEISRSDDSRFRLYSISYN